MNLRRVVFVILAATFVAGLFTFTVTHVPDAHAQLATGLEEIGGTVKLPSTDPRVIAARIINVALGLVGIILVVLIVYAGFLYMTSGGDAEKTQTALKYIRNAIIGLIIVLSSWAIARFVIDRLISATTGGGGVSGGGPSGGGGFGGAGGADVFKIVQITPQGSVTTKKVVVKIVFNKQVGQASATAAGAVTVEKTDGTQVPGTVTVDGTVVRFAPSQPCPDPNADRRCFDDDTDYRVKVAATVESTGGRKITCGGFAPSCEGLFKSGTTVDVTPPNVSITYPLDGQPVSSDALVDVSAYATDETAVAYVTFADGTTNIGDAAPQGSSPQQFDARVQWDTAGIAAGSERTLTATAYDVDTGVKVSDPVKVIVRAASCFNGVQDANETGIDCGGDENSAEYCGSCAGSTCTSNTQCASGVCSNGICVEQPTITSVTPNDGAIGSYVTLKGVNFGTNGIVRFLGPSGDTGVDATVPQACVAYGAKTWSPTEVIVEVPAGAKTGPIRLTNNASALADATNAPPNPYINDFLVNDTVRPGICAADPNVGSAGTLFRLIGKRFGATASGIAFGEKTLSTSSWTDEETQALIPNVAAKAYPVTITVSGETSNPVGVRVVERGGGGPPEITEISPAAGPVGTYVTISGKNFTDSVGSVIFKDVASEKEALADTNFPPACSLAFWSDASIVVKVPPAFTKGGAGSLDPGAYAVRVVTPLPGTPPSNQVNFSVNTDPATPGICAVVPSVAPIGTAVQIHGERFTSGPGTVTFFQSKNGTATPWTDAEISSAIPTGALSGPVTVRPSTSGLTSNGYRVEVRNCNEASGICKTGEECCTNGACTAVGQCQAGVASAVFAWRTSTGLIPRAPRVVEECRPGAKDVIPSPAPWSGRTGGDQACVNAPIVMRFTSKLEPSTVLPPAKNIAVFECIGTGPDPCAETAAVAFAQGYPELQAANATQDYVTLVVDGGLKVATTYRVALTTGIKGFGPEGANMVERSEQCGAGNSYCFNFRTRADAAPCAIGSALVAPDPYTANESERVDYAALPLAKDDACTVLLCKAYDWAWGTSDGRAAVTNNLDLSQAPPVGACAQHVTGQLETGRDPVKINASTAGVTGSGDFYLNFIPPKVVDEGPNCQEACLNAAIWAVFNVALDPNFVNASNVVVKQCVNEQCLEFVNPPLPITDDLVKLVSPYGTSDTRLRQIDISPVVTAGGVRTSLLLPGRYYKVTLRGGTAAGIRSASGVPMTDLNDPDGFSWTFRTKVGDKAFCEVDKILMAPTEKYETVVNVTQGFAAAPFSSPDACSEKGQQLILMSGYAWASSKESVATLIGDGQVDTGADLPPGCGNTCLWQGSAGRAGKTAQCGNGIVETTNAAYCVGGKTPSDQDCNVLPADGKGGEECDDANDNSNDACSNSCLWNPVTSVDLGGTCGNGALDAERGEECDFGKSCRGAAPTSTTPDGFDCTIDSIGTECQINGGTCAARIFRGCSPTCRNLGSPAASPPSTCGNADIADGEDCDDGNVASGDGCSNICLHEGSSKGTYALCGNEKLEPGEACEKAPGGAWPAPGCDPAKCLRTGVAPCAIPGETGCCGNGDETEPGKDCDDGNAANGDGCSAICLLEGSKTAYRPPSFCSNGGDLEIGEQCEAPGPRGGDGLVDPYQIALMLGLEEPDDAGKMSTDITASLPPQGAGGALSGGTGRAGTAVYGLQCGYSDEQMCNPPDFSSISNAYGLTDKGCCSLRPALSYKFPPVYAGVTVLGEQPTNDPFPEGVCRNVLINGEFNTEMDESSVSNNFLVAKMVFADTCPEGQRDVTDAMDEATRGFRGFVQRLWRRILVWFGGRPAYAEKWCAGTVTGQLQFTTGSRDVQGVAQPFTSFAFTLDAALEPLTMYRVRFLGDTSSTGTDPLSDNAIPGNRWGVKSKRGVVARQDAGISGPLTWNFVTGKKICEVSGVELRDLSLEHPNFFNRSSEKHPFVASALSLQNGIPVPLSPVASYAWAWQNWAFSNPTIIGIEPPTLTPPVNVSRTSKDIVAKNVSGSGFLSARLRITSDDVNVPRTADKVIQGTAHLTVNLCENPWPSISSAPFRDSEDSGDLAGTPFQNGPFYNFSVTYCRDAGETGPNGDLPGLLVNAVKSNPVDAAQGIVRQYLFTFRENALKKDAIGVRVATNPLHVSPLEWYRSRGFKGNPKPITIDGYQAIQDERTVYVSAANTDGPNANGISSDIYSNIYLISYNDGAEPVTRQIFDALLKSFAFNVNVQYDVTNACQDEFGGLEVGADGLPVTCTADWECDKLGSGKRCASFKGKIQRDLARLADFQTMSKLLEAAKKATGKYPVLAAGSYLPGLTTSLWPSWSATLGKDLGGSVPKDPVNRFFTCGRCGASKTACVTDSDCPTPGEVCITEDGFDPATCWNEQQKQYRCPFDPNEGPKSRLYQYRSLQVGARFELASDFEVPPPDPDLIDVNWWQPRLFEDVKLCVTPETKGNFCTKDEDCRFCPLGVCTPTVVGACLPVGGQFRYANVCGGTTAGLSGSCGDGVLDVDPLHATCLGGTNDGKKCTSNADCSGFTCAPNEMCELVGPSAKKFVSCTTTDGDPGKKQQACLDCRRYVDDPKQPGCFALKKCGDGKVDGACSADPTVTCRTNGDCDAGECDQATKTCSENSARSCVQDSDCSDAGQCSSREVCDDGVLNGTAGHCNAACTGLGGYCGDGQISPGETCDKGSSGSTGNGAYCSSSGCVASSCNLTCNGPAPYCGDQIVNGNEVCDGNSEEWGGALCELTNLNEPCTTNDECGTGGRCGPNPNIPGGGATSQFTRACGDGFVCAGPGGLCNPSNTPCLTDSDCGALENGCVKQQGKVCSSGLPGVAQCGTSSECKGPYAFVRTRTCRQTTSPKCSFNDWSICHPSVWCGDGVVNPGESCDDGNLDDTDACTSQCMKNVCGDGKYFKGVEECDLGTSKNGTSCTSAEYGSTCSSCSKTCKLTLTQGGYCGNGTKDPGSPEQCDGASGITNQNITCNGLGYDFAKKYLRVRLAAGKTSCDVSCGGQRFGRSYSFPLTGSFADIPPACTQEQLVAATVMPTEDCYGAQLQFTGDVITCKSDCTFTGCGYCGDEPGNGAVAGYLKDTLFQQPVQNARVTLYYRGLQVQQTTSDDTGWFKLESLDTHAGCNQYKIVIDSYADNPLTTNLDESKRGGYLPVTIGPFDPNQAALNAVVVAADQGQLKSSDSGDLVQINMLPRLGPNEYIAQFWWDPMPGNENGFDDLIQEYQAAADKAAFYDKYVNDYHDLVIRTPFTFQPGTYGSCGLSPTPEAFDGDGEHQGKPEESVDRQDPWTGMENCTNKIRATAKKTCVIKECNAPDDCGTTKDGTDEPTNLGCTFNQECTHPAKYNLTRRDASGKATHQAYCEGGPEPERSGPLKVLEGSAGAYLFCFHPEDPDRGSDCTNFVLPPQSAFISGKGGQYDVMVSQFRMFQDWANGPGADGAIWKWLTRHKAEIRIYDKNGLFEKFPKNLDFTGAFSPSQTTQNVCPGARPDPLTAGMISAYPPLYDAYAKNVNQTWIPLSIDTTNRQVKVWNNGTGLQYARYTYFSDLFTDMRVSNRQAVGSGICFNQNCSRDLIKNAAGTVVSAWPPEKNHPSNSTENMYICNGEKYSGQYDDEPACDDDSKTKCKVFDPTVKCAKETKTPSDTGPCIQFCTTNGCKDGEAGCECDGFVNNSTIPAFCGGYTRCSAKAGQAGR